MNPKQHPFDTTPTTTATAPSIGAVTTTSPATTTGPAATTATGTGPTTSATTTPASAIDSVGSCSISMATIGFGINTGQVERNDATEAAHRALQDALNRSVLRIPTARCTRTQRPIQMHIRLGVPQDNNTNLMHVDLNRLKDLIPASISVLPVETIVGGLYVDNDHEQDTAVCAVVACVTLRCPELKPTIATTTQTTTVGQHPVSIHLKSNARPKQLDTSSESFSSIEARPRSHSTDSTGPPVLAAMNTKPIPNSMDLLAQISEEVRAKNELESIHRPLGPPPSVDLVLSNGTPILGPHGSFDVPSDSSLTNGPVGRVVGLTGAPPAVPSSSTSSSSLSSTTMPSVANRKVPPSATTAKNNRRQFVQHKYTDHAYDRPTAVDGSMVLSGKSSSMAFPIKLHEILSKVERDGLSSVISWQPHGRSFKIHQHEEFSRNILQQYFVMTKKSSFLRQLNLYGFNRLSAGPDNGAYYHELFLRGMPFLCRRMSRVKINGKVIRAAGNPDQEPNFYQMVSVPLSGTATARGGSGSTVDGNKQNGDPLGSNAGTTTAATTITAAAVGISQSHTNESLGSTSIAPAGQIGIATMDESPPRSGNNGQYQHRTATTGTNGSSDSRPCFPFKLQAMLDRLEEEGNDAIIAWLPHGRAFIVVNPDDFVNKLMPQYFRQTK